MASTSAQSSAKKAGKQLTVPIIANGISVGKETNFSLWYQEVVTKCELVEYYTEVGGTLAATLSFDRADSKQISGFYILRRKTIRFSEGF